MASGEEPAWMWKWNHIDRYADAESGNEADDAYNIGRRDGFSDAVQIIDELTGGDGEYRFCTVPDEGHCPDPNAMIERIVARLRAFQESSS